MKNIEVIYSYKWSWMLSLKIKKKKKKTFFSLLLLICVQSIEIGWKKLNNWLDWLAENFKMWNITERLKSQIRTWSTKWD